MLRKAPASQVQHTVFIRLDLRYDKSPIEYQTVQVCDASKV